MEPPTFDAGTYGRSFADVYDDWYGDRDPTPLVDLVGSLGRGLDVLELGAGTGRVALPLAAAGHRVTALDASPEMLERLAARAGGRIACRRGDAARIADYPVGPFDVVVAAFNLICNLADRAEQAACVAATAARLRPGGTFVVEAFVPDVGEVRRRDLVTGRVDVDRVVLIATDADPVDRSIRGAHIELRDGSVAVRPWRVCTITPAELDVLAGEAGLELVDRRAGPGGPPFDADEHGEHCTTYRRPG